MFIGLKLLILEDCQSDAELLQYELKKTGLLFNAEIVQNQDDYSAALDTFEPDIILSDSSLPSFDGISAFYIKQQKNADIPFIIVSGSIGEENAVELIKQGITDYALKDKLFSLAPKISRALKDAETIKAKRLAEENLRQQNEKLREIAFFQSHQVRVPVTHILGLYNLFNFDDPADPKNAKILQMLKVTAESLDDLIRDITQKTIEISATL